MTKLPDGLEEAIAQAMVATNAALADGKTRLQVEFVIPELKMMPVTEQFLPALEDRGAGLRVFFPDPGAAALARRDWGEKPYSIRGIGELKAQIQSDETLFLFIEPSSIEVEEVEALCNEVGDRPVVFLNPHLEDIATVGIGYAARQLRQRFLNSFESCYYICALEGAIIFRNYPSEWQVWGEIAIESGEQSGSESDSEPESESDSNYKLLAEFPHRPTNEDLDQLFDPIHSTSADPSEENLSPKITSQKQGQKRSPKKRGLFGEIQNLLRALSQ